MGVSKNHGLTRLIDFGGLCWGSPTYGNDMKRPHTYMCRYIYARIHLTERKSSSSSLFLFLHKRRSESTGSVCHVDVKLS